MKVLLACEESQAVCKEFRRLGHDAYSCDILPCSGGHPEWHIQEDIIRLLMMDVCSWDMMIAFPPCTYLCSSGLHWNKRVEGRQQKTDDALGFVNLLLTFPILKIALENPVGCISTKIRKYDQAVQPWQFGDDASKKTCLWLKGLPKLTPTEIVPPKGWSEVRYASEMVKCKMCDEPFCLEHGMHYADCACIGPTQDEATYKTVEGFEFATLQNNPGKPVWGNQTPGGQNKLGPSPDRARIRSKTFPGIARAMANTWG